MSAFINFSDLFYYWGPGYGRRRDALVRRPDEMTFFESIFSFGALLHPRPGSMLRATHALATGVLCTYPEKAGFDGEACALVCSVW